MLHKHQNEFLAGGDYDKIRNVTLCATNRSGKQIFALINRLLLSHSKMRAPLIDGILQMLDACLVLVKVSRQTTNHKPAGLTMTLIQEKGTFFMQEKEK